MSTYDKERKKNLEDLRHYMEMKYSMAYMTAISKLSADDKYDKNGFLKAKYELTSQERDALMFFVPETAKFFDLSDTVKKTR